MSEKEKKTTNIHKAKLTVISLIKSMESQIIWSKNDFTG